jgi:hypothetical protein
MPPSVPLSTPLRVTLLRPIITKEGDLIVRGTPGTVRCWDAPAQPASETLVMVRWDHYLFTESSEDGTDSDYANTHKGLLWPVHPYDLMWSPHRNDE